MFRILRNLVCSQVYNFCYTFFHMSLDEINYIIIIIIIINNSMIRHFQPERIFLKSFFLNQHILYALIKQINASVLIYEVSFNVG